MFRPVRIRHYLALMKAMGHNAEAVLKNTGITESLLENRELLVDENQSRLIVSNMISLTGDQGIGLEIGNQTHAPDLGLVGYLVMTSKTNREAVRQWINYSNALVGVSCRLRLEENAPDDWAIVFEQSGYGFVYNFCVEEQLVLIYNWAGELSGTSPVMKLLELSYPAPSHRSRYPQYFRGPIEFNAQTTRISFSAPRIDQPIRTNDPTFNEMCERQCEMLMLKIGQHSPFVAKIRNILMRSTGEIPSVEAIARQLRIGPRTLRRYLSNEGFSYQQVVKDFRADMAKEYLGAASMATKEISYLLGFRDPGSFRRAFRSWTGRTVEAYRREVLSSSGTAIPPRDKGSRKRNFSKREVLHEEVNHG